MQRCPKKTFAALPILWTCSFCDCAILLAAHFEIHCPFRLHSVRTWLIRIPFSARQNSPPFGSSQNWAPSYGVLYFITIVPWSRSKSFQLAHLVFLLGPPRREKDQNNHRDSSRFIAIRSMVQKGRVLPAGPWRAGGDAARVRDARLRS